MTNKRITLWVLSIVLLLSGCSTKKISQPTVETQTNTTVETKVRTIFALWDSLTAWYQLPLEESYPMQLEQLIKNNWYSRDVVNGWKSGETSSGLLQTVEWITADAQPWDIAVVTIWWNDWLQSLSIEQLSSNLRDIVSILVENDLRIVVWWMQIPTNFNPTYRDQFAWIYTTVVWWFETNVTLLPFLLEGVAWDRLLNLPDWIHPNKEWYSIVAQTVYDHLLEQWLLQ